MKKIQMLTQDNCAKCIVLEKYLERSRYFDLVEVVDRGKSPKEFMALVRKHQIMATPALIYGEEVLRDTSEEKVKEFFGQVDVK